MLERADFRAAASDVGGLPPMLSYFREATKLVDEQLTLPRFMEAAEGAATLPDMAP
jgi:hypothetical protein